MNHDPSLNRNQLSGKQGTRKVGKKSVGSIAAVIFLVIYGVLQPKLNDRFGWNLPGLNNAGRVSANTSEPDRVQQDRVQQGKKQQSSIQQTRDEVRSPSTPTADRSKASVPASRSAGETASAAAGAQRSGDTIKSDTEANTIKAQSGKVDQHDRVAKDDRPASDNDEQLFYGLLREVGPDRYLSPQGLQYTPGSAEGHRLEHVRRHTSDQPKRAGKHGVFDGGMEGALATIDRAYERAKKNQRTTKQIDRQRTIYTVDMGKRVGYVGGRDGNRRNKPMARRVKLVLEGTRVITAFPL